MFDTRLFLTQLSARWALKYPTQETRLTKGLALALAGKVAPRGLGSWRVVGSAPGTEYTVEVRCGYPSCTCPDATRRETRCKHIWAAALLTRLVAELQEQLAQTTPKPAPKAPKKPLDKALGEHCAKLHDQNHARMRALQESPA